jgi:DNA-binding transcriptional regulator PaaX
VLKGLVWQLVAGSKLIPSTWVGEDAAKIFTKFALKLSPSVSGVGS